MFGIASHITALMEMAMERCNEDLVAGNEKSKMKYQFGTQRPSINYLRFMDDPKLYAKDEKQLDSLVNTVQIFSLDIGMEFDIDKCRILVMKRY